MSGSSRNRHTLLLAALAVGMFGFAFALVPLYNVICDLTGINGKASAQASLIDEINASAVTADRPVTVEFLARVARGMPWEFQPTQEKLVVRPGEMTTATFFVRNLSHATVTGQAVPSVSPGQASLYLKKLECFCFNQQELAAGDTMEMPVSFYVDADMPDHINKLTLSYTMFLVGDVPSHQMARHHEPGTQSDHE